MRRLLLTIAAVLLLSSAAVADLTIRGDELWRATTECPANWADPDLDDHAWQPVQSPWVRIAPKPFPDPEARPFWEASGHGLVCVRRVFELPDAVTVPVIAYAWADDAYDFALNGQLIGSARGREAADAWRVTPWLRPGRNVVALKLDGGAFDMGVIFSMTIPSVADVPLTNAQRLQRLSPWLLFAGIIFGAMVTGVTLLSLRRRLAPALSRFPAIVSLTGIIVLVLALQGLFLTQHFYDAEWSQPWCLWDRRSLALCGALLAALFVWSSGYVVDDEATLSRRQRWMWLGLIVLLALVLRTYRIDSLPTGMWGDESLNGNEALALYEKRGIQIWSTSLGGRGTLFMYLVGAVLKVVGVSYLSVKIVPIALGVAGVLATYAVGRFAFGSRVGLWAAFFVAVSRYDIHYSRMAWEAICVPVFSAAGFALLLHGLSDARGARAGLLAAGPVIAAGLHTYAAYRAVPAAVVVFLVWTLLSTERVRLWRRLPWLLGSTALALLVLLPLLIFAYRNPALYWARYAEVSLTEHMRYYRTPLPWLHQIGRSLLAITHRGDVIVRHNLPQAPHVDPITGGLMLVGLVSVGAYRATGPAARARLGARLLWSWFITYVALASLTRDGPHATRLIGMIPIVALFAGHATWSLLARLEHAVGSRAVRLTLAALLVTAATARNAYEYFDLEANWVNVDYEWQAMARRLCEYVRAQPHVELYWSEEVWRVSHSQCEFLAHGHYTAHSLALGHLQSDVLSHGQRGATVIAIGRDIVDQQRELFPPSPGAAPLLNLPVAPVVERDRHGEVLYYMYHF